MSRFAKLGLVFTLAFVNLGALGTGAVVGEEAAHWKCTWCAGSPEQPDPHVCCAYSCAEACDCPQGAWQCAS